MYGWCVSVDRLSVMITSRKSIAFLFASMVIFGPFLSKVLRICSMVISISCAVPCATASPSSLYRPSDILRSSSLLSCDSRKQTTSSQASAPS